MTAEQEATYHYDRRELYMRRLSRLFDTLGEILPAYLDRASAGEAVSDTKREFAELLRALPYIGGDEHPLSGSYLAGAAALACIRALEKRGLSTAAIGEVIYDTYARAFSSLPLLAKAILRRREFSAARRRQLKDYAARSQERKYPDDWVMEYVEGDGSGFDYGTDYRDCAVLKFFRRMGAEKYMPYICVGDIAASRALRTGLRRTTTLYYGAPRCDFRLERNVEVAPGLPLEGLLEYRNRKL